MKTHILFIILLFFSLKLSAQSQKKIDSLIIQLKNAEEIDTTRIKILNDLSEHYFSKNIHKSISFAEEALQIAQKIDYKRGIAQSSLNLCRNYWDLGDYPKALHYAYEGLKIAEKIKDKFLIASAYNLIGIIIYAQGNEQTAIKYYMNAKKLFEKLGELEWQAKVLNNIGEIYKRQKKTSEALQYYFQSLRINESINSELGRAVCLNNIGEVYNQQKNYAQALEYFIKSLNIKEKLKNQRGLAITLNNIASTYENIGEYESAQQNAEKALKIATEAKLLSDMVQANFILSGLYARMKDYDRAYEYFHKYNSLKDSLFSREKTEKISEIQIRYETEKREKSIQYLQAKRERDRLLLWLFAIALLIAGGIVVGFYLLSRYRYSKNREILERNQALTTAREEVKKANLELRTVNANLEEIVRDRTAKLRQVNEELTLSNRELDMFIYRASHDFKAPFASLLGLIHLGKLQIADIFAQELFDKMENTILKADSMLNKMLMMNTINHRSGKTSNNYQLIDFECIIQQIIQQIPPQITEAERIEYQINIEKDIQLISDSELIGFILQNLIENATFYAFENHNCPSIISIIIQSEASEVQIQVKDNGVGISESYYEDIFKMFFRGSELSKGNGLGLFVVKRALEKLKGNIEVDSKVNEYTCFKINIPQTKLHPKELVNH